MHLESRRQRSDAIVIVCSMHAIFSRSFRTGRMGFDAMERIWPLMRAIQDVQARSHVPWVHISHAYGRNEEWVCAKTYGPHMELL